MQARLIVKAKPNNMLCISSMTYKFVHWAGGDLFSKKQLSSEVLLLLCSVRRSCTVHVEMKPQ